MNFDDEVDALKQQLEDERGGGSERRERVAALKALRDALVSGISSRRLEFHLEDDPATEDGPSLLVVHTDSGDELGAVFSDDDGFSFESEQDDYFANVPSEDDAGAFARRLYDSLKTGLPAYELDVSEDD